LKASLSVTPRLERFTEGRLSHIPGTVKLCASPGRAGGLPMIITLITDFRASLTVTVI
jgi:hypothetical protein